MTQPSQSPAGRAQRPETTPAGGDRARRVRPRTTAEARRTRAPSPFARLLGRGDRGGGPGGPFREVGARSVDGPAAGVLGLRARDPRADVETERETAASVLGSQRRAAGATRGDARRPADAGLEGLAAFPPPLGVLTPPPTAPQPPPAAGSASAQAEAAALADRLVTSMRVGRTGRDRHEVRMRLSPRTGGIEVRLQQEGGRLTAVLEAEPHARADAERLARLFERELAERGLELDGLELC